jgi:hypothetical protein
MNQPGDAGIDDDIEAVTRRDLVIKLIEGVLRDLGNVKNLPNSSRVRRCCRTAVPRCAAHAQRTRAAVSWSRPTIPVTTGSSSDLGLKIGLGMAADRLKLFYAASDNPMALHFPASTSCSEALQVSSSCALFVVYCLAVCVARILFVSGGEGEGRVDNMQVDTVERQPPEACFERRPGAVGTILIVPQFGGDENLFPPNTKASKPTVI